MKILVIDDEPQILRTLRTSLITYGHQVRTALGGKAGLDAFEEEIPELVIVDLNMPTIDGYEVCRRVRSSSDVPIIVLSARDTERDKVQALDYGADDYITKPFGMNELLARIRAIMRRTKNSSAEVGRVLIGELDLDFDRHTVSLRSKRLKLSPTEYNLLKTLASCVGEIVRHETLLVRVWGADYKANNENLRVAINHLRRKIEEDPSNPRYIITEPWVGYRLCDPSITDEE
jgi:two-component system, OmpR family, KDP operon response regulator KdpE